MAASGRSFADKRSGAVVGTQRVSAGPGITTVAGSKTGSQINRKLSNGDITMISPINGVKTTILNPANIQATNSQGVGVSSNHKGAVYAGARMTVQHNTLTGTYHLVSELGAKVAHARTAGALKAYAQEHVLALKPGKLPKG